MGQRRMRRSGVVLFPMLADGHLVPMIELAKRLRQHSSTLSVTVLLMQTPFSSVLSATQSTASYVQAAKSSGGIDFIDLPLVEAHEGLEGLACMLQYVENLKPVVSDTLASLSTTTTISAFILDMFCVAMVDVAAKVHISDVYVFYQLNAAGVAYRIYFPTLDRIHQQDFKDLSEEIEIPGWPPLPPQALPRAVLSKKNPAYPYLLDGARRYLQLKGILVNTFPELEPGAMEALADGRCVPDGPTPRIYPVGPLLGLPHPGSEPPDHECIKWLDHQPCGSVVFLCFGSLGAFPEDQIQEMARGLELSGHRFLWSVKVQPRQGQKSLDEVLPTGFVERTRERGLVWPKWVPQIAVLSHSAVGGFVSHCGWNSTLESIWFGVPLVAWPLYAEQKMNAVLLVKVLGIAIGLKEAGHPDMLVKGEELQNAVKILMEGEEGKKVKEKMKGLKEWGRMAVQQGGSSYSTMAALVGEWGRLR